METSKKFPLGQVVATRGAFPLTESHPTPIRWALDRHQAGDWGEVCAEDKAANDEALRDEGRLLSVYLVGGVKIWIITEWDRSATTILLPEEY
jgi:hypothetical protein